MCCNVFMSSIDLTLINTRYIIAANDLHFYDGSSNADIIAGDVFFEILDPPELSYTYRIRPAKDFGAPFVSAILWYCYNVLISGVIIFNVIYTITE